LLLPRKGFSEAALRNHPDRIFPCSIPLFIAVSDFGVSYSSRSEAVRSLKDNHLNLLSLRLSPKPYIIADAKIKALPLNV
jgi:hypothetical protein